LCALLTNKLKTFLRHSKLAAYWFTRVFSSVKSRSCSPHTGHL